MKCQHCGINFEDTEKECPMCGARAGSRGRLSQRRGPSFRPIRKEAQEPTFLNGRIVKNPQSAKMKPAKKKGGKKAAVVIIAVIILILMELVPVLLSAASELGSNMLDRVLGEFESGIYDSYGSYEYDSDTFELATLEDLIGSVSAAALPDGNYLVFEANGDEYRLSVEGQYQESGEAWTLYNDPSGNAYIEEAEYPEADYDSYILCFEADEIGRADSFGGESTGAIWLVLQINRQTGELALDDWYGDAAFLFQGEQFLTLQKSENA